MSDIDKHTEGSIPRGIVGKLEFPLPEEQWAFKVASNSVEIFSTLRELDELMRSMLKTDKILSMSAYDLAERVRSEIEETLVKYSE